MIFRVLLILLIWASPSYASILWFAGAETGTLDEFTQTSSLNASAGTSFKLHGAYGYGFGEDVTNSGFGISKKGLGLTTGYWRLYWSQSTTTVPGISNIARWLNVAQNQSIELQQQTNNKLCFSYNSGACITTGTAVLAANVWYLIEAKSVVNASTGGLEVKINGVVDFTSFGTNTSSIVTLDQLQIGPARNSNFGRGVIVDDIAISDSGYIGAGAVLARQGAAGSPTYTAWTRNACSPDTIQQCWSQTPWNNPNASSATASAAQTMLVSTFALPSSGHGNEVVGSTSTINACKTSMIASSGTASAPMSIRRRLLGVDTDTAKTLTTSNVYYDDGIWTTTAAVLGGSTMEIGGVHGSGSATDTVVDMWMMCDVVPSASVPRHRVNFD